VVHFKVKWRNSPGETETKNRKPQSVFEEGVWSVPATPRCGI